MSKLKQLGQIPKEYSKAEIESLALADINHVLQNPQFDVLKLFVELRRYGHYLETMIERLKQPALSKAVAMGRYNFKFDQAELKLGKRTVYDFSPDPTWVQLNQQLTDLKNKLKVHQDLLKQVQTNHAEYVDEQTGEVLSLAKPSQKELPTIALRL
jgi:hypothetical protein